MVVEDKNNKDDGRSWEEQEDLCLMIVFNMKGENNQKVSKQRSQEEMGLDIRIVKKNYFNGLY